MNKTLLLAFLLFFCETALAQNESIRTDVLKGKVICIDPGHGGTAFTDSYRKGPSGEREEWVNLRVALILRDLLEERKARVVMTRTKDTLVSLDARAKIAREVGADLFLSIHHNATADSSVNFPIIYYHGTSGENKAGVVLGTHIARSLTSKMFTKDTPASVVSDHTIFPSAGAGVLRNTYGIPGVLAEASFFTNPSEEKKLMQETYNRKEASGYLAALEAFFNQPLPEIAPKDTSKNLPPFRVFQEAERMNEVARNWLQDFREGEALMHRKDTASWQKAYYLLTRSVRSFPDSYVAGNAHEYRAKLLEVMGKADEARQEARRASEFYPTGNRPILPSN